MTRRGTHPSTALGPETLTLHTLHQVYQQIVAAAQERVQVRQLLVAVRGRLGPLRDSRAPIVYRVPLHEQGETIYLDIPKALTRQADLHEGDHIKAVGVITAECNQFTDYRLLFKIAVSDIMVVDAPADTVRQREVQDMLALLRDKTARVPFPQVSPLHLSVIHGTSSQVAGDFQHEIAKVADVVDVEYLPVNMLSPDALADAIEAAVGDVLVPFQC